MYLSPFFAEAMSSWVTYGHMLMSIIAEDMAGDLDLILEMDTEDQIGLIQRWWAAGGALRRCPACWRIYSSRHKICECGGETVLDDWYSDGVDRMMGVLRPMGSY